ncbi:SH3 domain-containing protein [Bacillus cihuensis]|uniref:SH3 domain-containing protein n=1 Tax=Bacillus cihuensis TaxID=1208599 RepID=UPI000421627E|nr:SH3 domain-containing protein [Bacillus cihuensis]
MKIKTILKVIYALTLLLTVFIPLTSKQTQAATTQVGTIDVSIGKSLNVRNGANSKAKVIGTLKRSDKVNVFSQNSTWTKIQYGKGIGYISSDYVRFYKSTSLYSAKQITDRILSVERNMWTKTFTKQQFYQIMSPAFTKEYTDLYFKGQLWNVGKDKKGNRLYKIKPTEIHGQSIEEFDWYLEYAEYKPYISFYIKNGVEYLKVSQYHYYPHQQNLSRTTSLYLIKQPKSNWKAYKIERWFPNQ